MRIRFAWNLALLACTTILLPLAIGCSDDPAQQPPTTSSSSSSGGGAGGAGGAGGGANSQAVEINFEARVDNMPFHCTDKYPSLGMAGTEVSLTDFRLYVHDVRLTTSDGQEVPVELEQDGKWQYQSVVLLDFEDKTGGCANGTTDLNTKIIGKVPPGTYTGLVFKVGVPFDLNHSDAASAPSPLNLTGLFWSWNDGYKFLRIDSIPTAGGSPFLAHLGSTECMADANGKITSCARENRPVVQWSMFDTATNKVVIDYAALVANNDLTVNGGGAPGCMSSKDDPECASLLGQLGIHIQDGTVHAEEQRAFVKE